MNERTRVDWVNNHEPLTNMWKDSKLPMRDFVRRNREAIDKIINDASNVHPIESYTA
jgi:hypothetical protein